MEHDTPPLAQDAPNRGGMAATACEQVEGLPESAASALGSLAISEGMHMSTVEDQNSSESRGTSMPQDEAQAVVTSLVSESPDGAKIRDYINHMIDAGHTREQAVQTLQTEVARGRLRYTSRFDIQLPA